MSDSTFDWISQVQKEVKQAQKNIATLADRINVILDYLMCQFPEDLDELKTNKVAVVKETSSHE